MAEHKIYHGFAKWFRRCSLIILAAPLAYIICWALLKFNFDAGTTNYDNTKKAMEIIVWVNVVAGVLWLVLAIIMFFGAGSTRGTTTSPLGIRIGILIALAFVLAELVLSIVFQYHKEWEDETWVKWVNLLMPLINITGYALGAKLGGKVMNALA